MIVYAINGSPRKEWNTNSILSSFLDGAVSGHKSVHTDMIDLYDYNYHGCTECFGCKLRDGKFYGRCAQQDELTELLHLVTQADIIAFGSPIFFANVSGQLRCFMERFLYPYTVFEKDSPRTIAPKKIRTAFLYTMNAAEDVMKRNHYEEHLAPLHASTERVFGFKPSVLYSCFTYQYADYAKYAASMWDAAAKEKWLKSQFPKDCQRAFDLGRTMAASLYQTDQFTGPLGEIRKMYV